MVAHDTSDGGNVAEHKERVGRRALPHIRSEIDKWARVIKAAGIKQE
jgi:hypothetical protein